MTINSVKDIKHLKVLYVLAVFGLCVLPDTASTRQYFEIMYCGYCHTRIISGFTALEYCCTPKKLRVVYCGYCHVLPVSRPFRPLVVLRVLGVPKYSEHAQYTREYKVYQALRLSVNRFDSAIPILLQKILTDCPTSGSWNTLFSGGGNWRTQKYYEYHWQFRENTVNTPSIYRFNTLDTQGNPKYFGCLHGEYCLYSGICSAHTPHARYLGLLQLLLLLPVLLRLYRLQ